MSDIKLLLPPSEGNTEGAVVPYSMSTDYESDNEEYTNESLQMVTMSEFQAGIQPTFEQCSNLHFGTNNHYYGTNFYINDKTTEENNEPHNEENTTCITEETTTDGYVSSGLVQKNRWKIIIIGSTITVSFIPACLLLYFLVRPATGGLRMISNKEWLDRPIGSNGPLLTPVPYVVICHTVTGDCTNQATCMLRVKSMKVYHEENNKWSDIAYNFLVGGDGKVYEGRSWDTIGAHTKNYNNISMGIAMIGTFNDVKPPKRQLDALKDLIKLGVQLNKIDEEYKLFGHRQLTNTSSPGDALFNIIRTWDHFSETLMH